MSRALDANLTALLATNRCKSHTTLKLTLEDSTVVHLATGEVQIGAQVYQGQLRPSEPLVLSLTAETDRSSLEIQNVDRVFGQEVLNADSLVGAVGVQGIVFIDLDTGTKYHDVKIEGDVVAGEVDENSVPIHLVIDMYQAMIVGKTVGEVFPFQDRRPIAQLQDSNDIPQPTNPGFPFPGPGGGGTFGPGGTGRIPILELP